LIEETKDSKEKISGTKITIIGGAAVDIIS
jgi:hypothetical protein